MDVPRFYRDIAGQLDLDEQDAVRAAEAVLMALHLRLPEPAARQVEDMLPAEMRTLWEHGGEDLKEARGKVSEFSRLQFVHYVGDRLGVKAYWRSEEIIRVVMDALHAQLPDVDSIVRAELPDDIRDLWAGTHAAPAR